MKKFVIGGAAVLATAGIGLGLTQLANADPNSPKPTESSSVSVASEQASNQQGGPTDGQRGGPGGGMVGLRGVDTATLAQKLGVEESKLREALQSIQRSQNPGGCTRPGPAVRQRLRAGGRGRPRSAPGRPSRWVGVG